MVPPDENFWRRLAEARQSVLTLDYDGTLAPFKTDRMAALPWPGVMELVAAIAAEGATHVAIISGRPVTELLELLGEYARGLLLIGSHGWEWLEPGGPPLKIQLPEEIKHRLGQAYSEAKDFVADQPGSPLENARRVELKSASVAVHVRGLDEGEASRWLGALRRIWEPILSPGLEIMNFDGGLELRSRARDKGTAAAELWEMFPGADLVVHVGDDVTDEDVFRALPAVGMGIKVGGQEAETAARYCLTDIAAVMEFLVRWEKTITGPKGEEP